MTFLADVKMALPKGIFTKKFLTPQKPNKGIPTWVIEFGGHLPMLPPKPPKPTRKISAKTPVFGRFHR